MLFEYPLIFKFNFEDHTNYPHKFIYFCAQNEYAKN